ncbi:alginate lyase family protein [Victivallis vadensis]|uniref:alginate lyase family protein n=1 Tax=Victivallis vadensis TaxID=172901 RepID=UPI003AF48939
MPIRMILTAAALFAALLSPAADRLDALLGKLDLSRPGLEKVRSAETAQQKKAALHDYFRNRRIHRLLEFDPSRPPALNKREQEWAAGALEHKFPGQPAYPIQFRGGETLDWDTNPFSDKEWIWQLHRFYWWPALGKAYLHSKDEKYAKEWVFELNSWVDHMHKPETMKTHPGWRKLETGQRIALMPMMMEYFRDSPNFDADTLVTLLWSLSEQSDSLFRRMARKPFRHPINNHEIIEWLSFMKFTAAFPEFKNSRERAVELLDNIVAAQDIVMLDDGMIAELVTSYHMGYPGDFLQAMELAKLNGIDYPFPPRYVEKIEKAITAVMLFSHPNGTVPQFGDAWLREPGTGQRFVGRFLNTFKRPDWEYFASFGKKGKKPEKLVHTLEKSGFYTMRSGWDGKALFAVMKNSDTDYQYHNHMDNLSFELSAFGQNVMADSGCYIYSGADEWRTWFRQSYVHQTVTLDKRQLASYGKLLWSAESPGLNVISARNQSYPELAHTRTMFMVDGKYLVILDELSGPGTGTLRQHFQFMPGKAVLDTGSLIAQTVNPAGVNLYVRTMPGRDRIELKEEIGWISTVYTRKETRPAFAFVQEKTDASPRQFLTFLAPLPQERQIWDVELESAGEGKLRLRVNRYEDYTITFDPVKKSASLKKNFDPAERGAQRRVYTELDSRR